MRNSIRMESGQKHLSVFVDLAYEKMYNIIRHIFISGNGSVENIIYKTRGGQFGGTVLSYHDCICKSLHDAAYLSYHYGICKME